MNKETDNQKSYNYHFEPLFNNSFQLFEQYPVNTRLNNDENVKLPNSSQNLSQNTYSNTNPTTKYVDAFGILPESTRINNKQDNSKDQRYYANPKNTHLPVYNTTNDSPINKTIYNKKTKYVENYQPLSMNQSMPINNKPMYDSIIPMNTRLDHSKPINSKKTNYIPNI